MVEHVAGLLEGVEGVGVEHLRPHVAVVARRVVVAGEDMAEVRRAVPHHDLLRHADAVERRPLEDRRVKVVGAFQRMVVEVDDRRGSVLDRHEALVEHPRRLELGDQRVRHRLPGAVVDREGLLDLRRVEPLLVELGRQLDEVGRHPGAGDQRVGDIGQQGMEGVAELVE
jgi:hypothetical protein